MPRAQAVGPKYRKKGSGRKRANAGGKQAVQTLTLVPGQTPLGFKLKSTEVDPLINDGAQQSQSADPTDDF
ncbi:hypothetical protein SARC_02691 [Sphaeroforma arctica JP610]|uniref:Uncharacterized protein n=1 Tax=Sphaeroforma arctica JP610 TaxID=667725 RepID=A0A0L0G8A3_9EUKA|nr:hypothetical protein SARC_02691 [Sphaeroforma arctica JP610]KNC85101.1 hypothetical protein SARC_02691 [Sphaeroforma arctica JP610]|eukprot:XP_014159003.1 hypothetical protein SARC_02691 [Sphaeroforma arctica JP610]